MFVIICYLDLAPCPLGWLCGLHHPHYCGLNVKLLGETVVLVVLVVLVAVLCLRLMLAKCGHPEPSVAFQSSLGKHAAPHHPGNNGGNYPFLPSLSHPPQS